MDSEAVISLISQILSPHTRIRLISYATSTGGRTLDSTIRLVLGACELKTEQLKSSRNVVQQVGNVFQPD